MKIRNVFHLIDRKSFTLSLLLPFLLFTGPAYGASRNRPYRQGPSHGVRGATKGGLGGAALGALIGAAAGDPGKGAAIGAASGLILGGAMGHSQDVRENEEIRTQDRIAQERAYRQEVVGLRERDAREAKRRSEDLAIREGLNVTPAEVDAAQKRADEAEKRLKELQAEVTNAKTRNKTLEEATARQKAADEKIRELEAQLEALKDAHGDAETEEIAESGN